MRLRRGSVAAPFSTPNPTELQNITPLARYGSDVLRARVSPRETADPPRLHTAARASVKSRAPETVLPGESHDTILHTAGNSISCYFHHLKLTIYVFFLWHPLPTYAFMIATPYGKKQKSMAKCMYN